MTPSQPPRPLLATVQPGSLAVKVSPAELRLLQASVRFNLRYVRDPILAAQLGRLASRLGLRATASAA